MTKMTKALRATILENVIKATTLGDEKDSILQRQSLLARKLVGEALPNEFVKMSAKHPAEWFAGITYIQANSDSLPINNLLNTSSISDFWTTINFEYISRPQGFKFDQHKDLPVLFADLIEEAKAWRDRHDTLTEEMTMFLLSCSTTEKLIAAMPELEKHVPVVTRSYPVLVSVTKLTDTLLALGFDKTLAVAA